jgi:PTS system mannose-specific IIA component
MRRSPREAARPEVRAAPAIPTAIPIEIGEATVKIGVVLVTHYRLGEELLQALRLIVPDAPEFQAVSVEPSQSVDEMRGAIEAALKQAEQGAGVLVLTDMFGGTPSNISLSFLGEHPVEVVTGVNLPMLIKLATGVEPQSLEDLAAFIKDYGRRNISVASEILRDAGS